jgi:type VI protein secretion system component VasK
MVSAHVGSATSALVQDWVSGHPGIGWVVTHPVWAIAILLLGLFLLWGLLQAIAQSAASIWVGLGKLPVWLFRGIWDGVLWVVRRSPPVKALPTPEDRLAMLFAELEQVQQQQQQLMQDIKVLLQQSSDQKRSRKAVMELPGDRPSPEGRSQ